MDSHGEMEDGSEQKERKPGETIGTLLGAKMAELQKLQGKLTKAKDEAVQSWLDSRPVIDELEKQQSELADAKIRTALANTAISEVESHLETSNISIRARKEEELKIKTMINRVNHVLQKTQEEMEQLKMEGDEKHRARMKLKQVLRLRRQTLRALQLSLRAIQLESEAYAASAAEAQRYIKISHTDDTVVKLTQEEYHALTKRAREETSLAEWRISIFMEQKQIVEKIQDSAARRLQDLYSNKGSRKRKRQADSLGDRNIEEELHQNIRATSQDRNGQNSLPKIKANLHAKSSQRKPQEQYKKSKSKNKFLSNKNKSSIFFRIRTFLVQKIKRYFK